MKHPRRHRPLQARQATGTYDPNKEPSEIKIDAEKAKQWIANGAQPTDTVRVLLKKSNVL
jgi:small subunit ribosomal protein S16